ncbi:hypothetical protein PR003_g28336 [Phytophthora rubi]|uniref:Major facilitator superfamily (MFS) profile domain-containing protein n=1 Tax=Phytophthora rubi TaxID=129364 RepID=A0A6A3HG35_9STRA|nr:hypothetical protein PR001_g27765 [Phytophthora rubi]KAE9279065.1 hypothetical protein PR003_g28336 [Phytophthora rubi]
MIPSAVPGSAQRSPVVASAVPERFMGNCIFIIVGGVVQTVVSNIWVFLVGRLIAGLASGTATATIGSYVHELSLPHMRNTLGLGLQIFTTIGILFPAIAFFFDNTSSGWRYLAAFPVVLGAGRTEEAEQVTARLYGVTLGPLVWVMTADIFPDSIRASASSLCIGINWPCNLIVGVSHPYISDALLVSGLQVLLRVRERYLVSLSTTRCLVDPEPG